METERKQAVLDALPKLDTTNDDHWTEAGKPDIGTVAGLSGIKDLKRADIDEAASGFNRANAHAAPSDMSNMGGGDPEGDKPSLPRYMSHKIVSAVFIAGIELREDGSAVIAPKEDGISPFTTREQWADRFGGSEEDPGVYVEYEDGFSSWSPTAAFEAGYTMLAEGENEDPMTATEVILREEVRALKARIAELEEAAAGMSGARTAAEVGTRDALKAGDHSEGADAIALLEAANNAAKSDRYRRNTALQAVVRHYVVDQMAIKELQERIDIRNQRRAEEAKKAEEEEAARKIEAKQG